MEKEAQGEHEEIKRKYEFNCGHINVWISVGHFSR